jgi:hypothetical protein
MTGGQKGKGKQVDHSPQKREKRILEERYQPVAAPNSLLSRIGPAPPNLLPLSSPATGKDDSISPSTTAATLKARLQERLTAEYRQALLKLTSSPASPSTEEKKTATDGGGKVDLRALLQSRLQAEKALAYDSAQRLSSFATSPSSDRPSLYSSASTNSSPSKTTFSQATKDLLLMRLEEERLLAQEQQQDFYSIPQPFFASAVNPTEAFSTFDASPIVEPPTPSATSAAKPSNESDLKAKLLEKRKLAVEEELKRRSGELKEKLMRDKLLKQKQLLAEKKKQKELDTKTG